MNPEKSSASNRLAQEKSPYLLQHAANPVDWYPWGPEAFDKAKKEDKVIFLSIGYSTCHWCHVMAHESFENEEVAKLLNEHFISIKVDREERPDVDQIYMTAVQAMTGSGGWPLTVFLTPDGRPFAGGTYFPPEDRWGRAGMKTLLPRILRAWTEDRQHVEVTGHELTDLLQTKTESGAAKAQTLKLDEEVLRKAYLQYESRFDPQEGGFGGAPKFPRSHDLSFLLRFWKRTKDVGADRRVRPEGEPIGSPLHMVRVTLEHMAHGGIHDHLGGGFHRYATDEHWLVPHFEKMLYDQALLAETYLEAYQATRLPLYGDVARDIFRYVLRDMVDPAGGFYSAEDADSEGEEGKFYVWRPEEISQVLGPELGRLFNEFYGVTDAGNFEHAKSILHLEQDLETFAKLRKIDPVALKKSLGEARVKLFEVRRKRIHPHKDDKILTAWNGLMISALARGTQVLGDEAYAEAAARSADFILKNMQRKDRLLRRFRAGEADILGYQEDYAFLALGLLDLYEATFEFRWLEEAKRLTEEMIRLFWDEKEGGFYFTAVDAEPLIVRTKEYYDGATPSGNSVAAHVMLRLARMLADMDLEKKAETLVQSNAKALAEHPMAYPEMLMALDFALGPAREIVLSGDPEDPNFKPMLEAIRGRFFPRKVLLRHPRGAGASKIEALAAYLKDQPAEEARTLVYVCENHVCKFPTSDVSKLQELLS